MKIDHKDLFHGAALTQLTEHGSFKALNKADSKYGHYLVNTRRRLLTKHSQKEQPPWQFTFQPDDLETLRSDLASAFKTFVVLVCGDVSICLLDKSEFSALIDVDSDRQQWIRVQIPKASMQVNGSAGSLKHKIKHNGFPNRVFL
ncbi:MAG: hypothetical protein ACYSWU_13660 [Planctomycetota bacterium]|jgi:hypothetical protein